MSTTLHDFVLNAVEMNRSRADLRAERDRFLRELEEQTRRSWWPWRRAE